jgi:hypothetical protein
MEATADLDTSEDLNRIVRSLDNLKGTAKALACKAPADNGTADEAWTLHDALRAVEQDVKELRQRIED